MKSVDTEAQTHDNEIWPQGVIHRVRKKGATLFFAITLPNPNRSSKFFHHHTQQ